MPTKKDPLKFLTAGTIEDLTGAIDFVSFPKRTQQSKEDESKTEQIDYNSFLQVDKKVIITGKLQIRDENSLQIVVDNVRPVENSNIVTISFNEELPFEKIVAIKDVISQYKGNDPLVIKPDSCEKKILASSNFWLKTNNELIQKLERNFGNSISVTVKSLETA